MPLIETKGAASAQGFGGAGAGASGPVTYIEDVFSTYLYTGNGSTQTINNGIDLSGKGGLVWIKPRNQAQDHIIFDTVGGITKSLTTNNTAAQYTATAGNEGLASFNNNGFTAKLFQNSTGINNSACNNVSWTFRKQPKFFDVVTYTGTGSARTVAHNLGSVPGCIMVKCTSAADDWSVYHVGLNDVATANQVRLRLNSTGAVSTASSAFWNNTTPTSTVFSVGTDSSVNASGGTYVAYLFAHDAGGFGLTGTDNVISCGSFTTDASANASVTLGYEPQFVLYKRSGGVSNWFMLDNMRGWNQTGFNDLKANLTNAENAVSGNFAFPTATGFDFTNSGSLSASATYIYIAIRRGPMKVPTSGTSVYFPQAYADISLGTNNPTTLGASAGFPVDFFMHSIRSGTTFCANIFDRLRGSDPALLTSATDAESTGEPLNAYSNAFDIMSGVKSSYNNRYYYYNSGAGTREHIGWFLRRAPGFFDEVCYTGTGANLTVTHNLGVVPEMMIVKQRSAARDWVVYIAPMGNNYFACLNDGTFQGSSSTMWNDTTPTASVFTVGTNLRTNVSAGTYVAYLFATCAGVSKVGSYTGTGALQTVNCGFTGGARLVLIKRTDSTGGWYIYDSARGISSGNDPYLLLNSTAAEVTGSNYVDTTSVGFQVTAAAPADLNANGGTYIFLAIA